MSVQEDEIMLMQTFNEVRIEKEWESHLMKYRVCYTFATLANGTPVIKCSMFRDGHAQHLDARFVDDNCDIYEPFDWHITTKGEGNGLYIWLLKRGFCKVK